MLHSQLFIREWKSSLYVAIFMQIRFQNIFVLKAHEAVMADLI